MGNHSKLTVQTLEMKTFAIILLLAATCLAIPFEVINNCKGGRTNCSGSVNNEAAANSRVENNCDYGANCEGRVRDKGEGPAVSKNYYDRRQYEVNNRCTNGSNCRTNVGGRKKRDIAAAMKKLSN